MNLNKEIERVKITITITATITNPFTADFEFEDFLLDLPIFQTDGLKEIKSFKVKAIDTGNRGNDDLEMIAIFEFNIRTSSKAYQDFVKERGAGGPLGLDRTVVVQKAFTNLVVDVVKYIGWRKDLSIHYHQFDKIKIDYRWDTIAMSSDDPSNPHYQFSNFEHFYLTTDYKVHLAPNDFTEFYSLKGEQGAIPLHYEILLEVDRLRGEGYTRSAYLMLYTAMEVATKGLIRYRKPDATWLINNMPSPNLPKMYREFINKEIEDILSTDDLAKLLDMMTTRNKVAHAGLPVQKETLDGHFELAKEWIRKIDFAIGYEWASKPMPLR